MIFASIRDYFHSFLAGIDDFRMPTSKDFSTSLNFVCFFGI